MLKISVYNQEGKITGEKELNQSIFGIEVKPELVHQAVMTQMSEKREAIAHTKKRGEVRGGGKKPWRQKGTGRARVGTIRSPLWRGGGVVFGPSKERNFEKKMNKKARRKALLMILTDKMKNNLLIVLDKITLVKGKTKEMNEVIKCLIKIFQFQKNKETKKENAISHSLKLKKNQVLIALVAKDEKIIRASRNIPGIQTISADTLNIVDLIKYKFFLTTLDGIDKIEKCNQ